MTPMPSLKTQQIQIGGMDCTGCKLKIEGSLERLKGVAEASVTVATGRLVVTYDPDQINEVAIQERIKSLGYTIREPRSATPQKTARQNHHHNHSDHGIEHNPDDGHT
ncbi:MAG TPA: heavy metal-associated domain-containing protein, partial [Allocoleopsis sp.]